MKDLPAVLGAIPRGGLPLLAVVLLAPLLAPLLAVPRSSSSSSGLTTITCSNSGRKDAPPDGHRRPLSAALCDAWTVASAVACALALALCDLDFDGLARLAGREEDAAALMMECAGSDAVEEAAGEAACLPHNDTIADAPSMTIASTNDALASQCFMACFVLGTAMALELMNVVTRRAAGSARGDDHASPHSGPGRRSGIYVLFGLPDSECLVFIYGVLFVVYLCTYFDRDASRFGMMFADPVAASNGMYRPVSTIRYVEWMVASPLLMSLVGRALPRKNADVEEVLRPGLVLTAVYIGVAWLALPIADPAWRWGLTCVSFVGFCIATYDQLTSWMDNLDRNVCPRVGTAVFLMKVQILIYFLYGLIFLLGPFFDVLSPVVEQAIYTFADSTIKIACSAFLSAMRYADALVDARVERNRAKNIANDLKQMILTASAPIFAIDRSFKVELWNDKFASLTGLSRHDVMGRDIREMLSDECRIEVFSILNERMNGMREQSQFHCDFDSTNLKKECDDGNAKKGRIVSVIMSATAKHDSGGLIVGVVGVGQDRTEVTRYRVIEQKQNEFMGVISHELKSPLHGIIGLAENLSQSEKKSGRRDQLKLIRSCATRLLDLVSNIMEMSKLRSGGGDKDPEGGDMTMPMRQLRKEPVDICSIVSEVCFLIKSSVDKANRPILSPLVEMMNELASDKLTQRLPIVEGDAYKITQVFYNLITNACKFCSSGQIVISSRVFASEGKITVSIADTGIGIDPTAIKRIFEPFEQESNSSKRSFGGIGLGLAISREVAVMHGGDLSVESTVGKGSTFTLSLPVTKEAVALSLESPESADSSVATSSAAAVQTTLSRRVSDGGWAADKSRSAKEAPPSGIDAQRKVILSVDDDHVNQEVIKSTLSSDYEIHVAMNGYDAIEYFSSNSTLPDLVLLDAMMPGLDGFEVLKHIRDELQLSPAELPVIMLSAVEPADAALVKSLSHGGNDYVSKPFDPSILKARVAIAAEVKRLRELERDTAYRVKLLNDILPPHIVTKLVDGEGKATGMSEKHDQVCLLFADIVGWTPMSEVVPTDALIALLNALFSEFDELTTKHNVFKADTIGDCYIVAAGHEGGTAFDATLRVVQFGIEMLEAAKRVRPPRGMKLQLRVGIHTGAAYSGVVGNKVPKYTFFGDTVNTASRMETAGISNCVNISSSAHDALTREVRVHHAGASIEHWLQSSYQASIVKREGVEVKGKRDTMDMYLICPRGVSPPLAHTLAVRRSSRASIDVSNNSLLSGVSSLAPPDNQPQTNETWGDITASPQAPSLTRTSTANSHSLLTSLSSSNLRSLQSGRRGSSHSMSNLHTLSRGSRRASDSHMPAESAGSSGVLLRAAWSEIEKLKAELLEARAEIGRLSGGSESSQTRDELKLKLVVTTKRLMKARQVLMEKEGELDMKELELQRALAARDGASALNGGHSSIPSEVMSLFSARNNRQGSESVRGLLQHLMEYESTVPTTLVDAAPGDDLTDSGHG